MSAYAATYLNIPAQVLNLACSIPTITTSATVGPPPFKSLRYPLVQTPAPGDFAYPTSFVSILEMAYPPSPSAHDWPGIDTCHVPRAWGLLIFVQALRDHQFPYFMYAGVYYLVAMQVDSADGMVCLNSVGALGPWVCTVVCRYEGHAAQVVLAVKFLAHRLAASVLACLTPLFPTARQTRSH